MKKCLFFSIFCLQVAFASSSNSPLAPQNFINPSEAEIHQGKEINDLKINNFYLNEDPKAIDEVIKKDKQIKFALDEFTQKEINYKPVILPISSNDEIFIHPYFTFSLLLPSGSKISYVDSSYPMAILKQENNAILVRPKSDFKIANLTILYKLKDKNQILNLLAHRYDPKGGVKLNLIYSYVDIQKRDDLEVIKAYITQNNAYPKDKYSYIQLDGITYRIVEDAKYGNKFINGKKYRIDNGTIYK